MNKIPVGQTLAQAFGFVFGDFVTLVKLSWLPAAVTIGLSLGAMRLFAGAFQQASAAAGAMNPMAMAQNMGLFSLVYLVVMVALLVQVISVARYALGLNPNPGWINFPLDMSVLRLVGAVLLVILIMIGIWLAMIVLGVAIGAAVGVAGAAAGAGQTLIVGLVAFVVMLVAICAYLYFIVRLTFLLIPVVVAEQRVGVGRTWSLGKGNFWRMLAVLICIFLPVLVLEVVVFMVFLPPIPLMPAGTPPLQAQAAIMAWEAGLFSRAGAYWYIIYPAGLLVGMVFYGLAASAQCFAYRALVPEGADADAFS